MEESELNKDFKEARGSDVNIWGKSFSRQGDWLKQRPLGRLGVCGLQLEQSW